VIAAAKAKLPLHIVALVPSTDNRPGSDAYAPGDVITMFSGDTVEVLNTDAEGRLVLADALHYAKRYQPELVLDFATLTGSAVRAVGPEAICYMGNADESIKSKMEESGFSVYERLIQFPLWKEYGDQLKSNIADLRNLGGSTAGMITAGKFLEYFTDYNWLHFDIAGSAYLKNADSYRPKEGTGVGVRLVFDFLKHY
jgi:Leucyl aminopeptidase